MLYKPRQEKARWRWQLRSEQGKQEIQGGAEFSSLISLTCVSLYTRKCSGLQIDALETMQQFFKTLPTGSPCYLSYSIK